MAIHKIKIFTGRDSEYLAKKIAASFGTTLGQSEVLRFSDGEFQPCYNESIRGCTVFIIQSTFPPSDNLMELLMMIDAARRASAHQVVAVMPYFGWARQDRKDRPRVPIGAKLVANMLMAAGVDRVMTMDLHADQIQGFFDVPVDALYASGIFVPYIKSLNIEDLSIAAPDMGGAKRANTYSKLLGTPIIISHKERANAQCHQSARSALSSLCDAARRACIRSTSVSARRPTARGAPRRRRCRNAGSGRPAGVGCTAGTCSGSSATYR